MIFEPCLKKEITEISIKTAAFAITKYHYYTAESKSAPTALHILTCSYIAKPSLLAEGDSAVHAVRHSEKDTDIGNNILWLFPISPYRCLWSQPVVIPNEDRSPRCETEDDRR
ncbi:hypothetical protein HCH54_005247 [Aspergillus fumigatus]